MRKKHRNIKYLNKTVNKDRDYYNIFFININYE
jgi:hypothetical protein